MEAKELEQIISKGSIEEIERFVMPNFHKIKHTVSFGVLIRRLRELQKELEAVKANNIKANTKLKEIWEMFYGQKQAVVGWHLNGDHEPMDNFFDNNDWDYDNELLKGGK